MVIYIVGIIAVVGMIFWGDIHVAQHLSDKFIIVDHYHKIQNMANHPNLHILCKFITHFGEGYFELFLIMLFYIKKEYRKYIKGIIYTFISSGVVVLILKYLVGRKRPYYVKIPTRFNGIWHIIKNYDFLNASMQSFPSGHTTTAFATLGFLVNSIVKNIYIKIALWFIAIGVGISRIMLSKHWGSDVVAGALLGYFIGNYFAKKINNQN